MTFDPTDEQQQIVASIEAGDNIAVQALAGTGKTATLLLGAEAKERRLKQGLYVSFGKKNRADAEKRFPATVTCKTSHALAWDVARFYQRRWKDAKGRPPTRRTPTELAQAFGTKPFAAGERTLTKEAVAVLAKRAVIRYCRGTDEKIGAWHVPAAEGIDGDPAGALKKHVLPYAQAMWRDLQDPHSDRAQFDHDCYMKIWALKKPKLDYNFIMLDEAQDTNALFLDVLLRQGCQLIAVGDSCQTLYSWRGALDALGKWPADQRLSLTESFRFGPQIAEAANDWLAALGEELRLSGRGPAGRVGPLTQADAILCRTNAGAIEAAWEALQTGQKVGMDERVADDIKGMCKAALQLQAGQPCDHRAFSTFASWREVMHYVQTDPTAGDLAVFARLVEKWGAAKLLQVAKQFKNPLRAKVDVVVMTGHQSKGMEYPRVKIGPDFYEPALGAEGDLPPIPAAYLQLCYVATTRAQRELDNTTLSWIKDYLRGEPTETQLEHWYQRELRKAAS